MTALADAFEDAGGDPGEAKLYAEATRLLHKYKKNVASCEQALAVWLLQDCGVVLRRRVPLTLIAAARCVLEQCLEDMNGIELRGEGQITHAGKATRIVPSASQQNDDWVGQVEDAAKACGSLPTQSSSNSSGDGHTHIADKANTGMPSSAAYQYDGPGQISRADRAKGGMPAPVVPFKGPNAVHLAAAGRVAKEAAKTIFDRVRFGDKALGDWTPKEALKAAPVLAHLARYAMQRYANCENKPFREALKIKEAEQLIKEAEGADAA